MTSPNNTPARPHQGAAKPGACTVCNGAHPEAKCPHGSGWLNTEAELRGWAAAVRPRSKWRLVKPARGGVWHLAFPLRGTVLRVLLPARLGRALAQGLDVCPAHNRGQSYQPGQVLRAWEASQAEKPRAYRLGERLPGGYTVVCVERRTRGLRVWASQDGRPVFSGPCACLVPLRPTAALDPLTGDRWHVCTECRGRCEEA